MTNQQLLDLKYLDSSSSGLSEWEQDFVISLFEKGDKYILTELQEKKIKDLLDRG